MCAEHRDRGKREGMALSLCSGAFLTSSMPLSQVMKHFELQFPQVAWGQIIICACQYSCKIPIHCVRKRWELFVLFSAVVIIICGFFI